MSYTSCFRPYIIVQLEILLRWKIMGHSFESVRAQEQTVGCLLPSLVSSELAQLYPQPA